MRFIHDNLFPLTAALVFVVAVSCGFGASAPALPKAPAPVAEPWNLPKLAESDSNKAITAITARNLWGTVAAEAPKAPEWHVLGVAMNGADRFILLAYEGKPVEILKVGDTLLDGTKIVQIERDRFFVVTPEKKKLAYGIYKHDQAK